MTATYQIGDSFPLEGTGRVVSAVPIEPTWHALIVPPMREQAVVQHLKRQKVYAFFPDEVREWRNRGTLVKRKFPIVSTHVFALFRFEPRWHVLKERRRLITGVFAMSGRPYPINRTIIRHLQGLSVSARELDEAREDLKRVRAGDRVEISQGPFSTFFADVDSVDGAYVWLTLMGTKMRVHEAALTRQVPESEETELLQKISDGRTGEKEQDGNGPRK